MSDLNRDKSHRTAINTLRFLAVDMVEQANSGHPGAPMGLAPLAYLLWTRHLRHDPRHPDWPNRDRFVLSCGHASALIYGLLHLAGFDLPMEELRRFRQLGSKTPGHPEYGLTPGVETTTGPLGQGFATAVGMAMAREHLAARFNRPGHELFDHRVWVVASDGDLMEGVAAEAASLAGHQKLGCLKVFYDDNRITIDGGTDLTFTEDTAQRFEAYGWFVQTVSDGRDLDALEAAAEAAAAEEERPSLVVVRTHIGYGSPNKQDTSKAHGSPLGEREVALTKDNLGWPQEPTFLVPDGVRESFEPAAASGAEARRGWLEQLESYRRDHPDVAADLDRRLAGELPEGWRDLLPRFAPEDGPIATRSASGKVLTALVPSVRELVGGSADLAGSNNTTQPDEPFFSPEHREGRNHHFGVREHAMAAAANGMALSGLLTPYYATFLIFSDYLRPALRLGALMGVHSIAVLTHDSIFLGEDGPTHQPISQLLSLRSIPRVTVLRPADANETAAAWAVALTQRQGPVAMALTRQKLPVLAETATAAAEGVARGAYVLSEATAGAPRLLLLATGSEVEVVLGAQRELEREGVATRVVSMPSWELFEAQPRAYREQVLPPDVPLRLAVEAGSPMGWDRYVGPSGAVVGLDGFGESAPFKDLAEHFGFTVKAVVERARALLADG